MARQKQPQGQGDKVAGIARESYYKAHLAMFDKDVKILAKEHRSEDVEDLFHELGTWFRRHPDALEATA